MTLSAEHKEKISRWCDKMLSGLDKEMEMVDEEVEKMRSEPRRCPICDYERMVKTRHYLLESVHEALAIKGLIGS